jgi:4-hydroxy-2-oxoglutarate aldolase
MNMNRQETIKNLKGIFVPVVTPFQRDGEIDEGSFRENISRYAALGLAGILVAGSTGEAPYLNERERLRLVEIAREIVRPPQLLLAGTGLESTRATILLSREAAERGADALLLLTPAYYRPRLYPALLAAHYRAVADQVQKPTLIYSIPQFTGISLPPETVAALSRHPNIVGIKDSSGNLPYLRAVLRGVPPRFRVMVGSALILVDALRGGATGAVLGPVGFVPDLCLEIYHAVGEGKLRIARQMHKRLCALAQSIALPYGVAGVKAALNLSGYAGGWLRPPLAPLAPAERKKVAAALRELRISLEF